MFVRARLLTYIFIHFWYLSLKFLVKLAVELLLIREFRDPVTVPT